MTKYTVYIFLEDPYNGTTIKPPIHNMFNTLASTTFNDPIVYLQHPNMDTLQDSQLGIHCGRQKCDGCDDTFKMRAVSSDYLIFKKVLELWLAGPNKNDGVIIVKPTTVALSKDVKIEDFLNDAIINTDNQTDIFYLSKWLDRPEKYITLKDYESGGKLIRTYSPHGLQAYALTVKGLNKLYDKYNPAENPVLCRPFSQVIHMLVENGTLYAASTTPTLMFYDATRIVLKTRKSAIDEKARFSYLKTCEARGEIHPEEPLNRRISADLSFFWLLIIIVIIFITISVIYCKGRGGDGFCGFLAV